MPTCPECKARFARPAKGVQTFCSRSCRLKAWRRERHRANPEKVRAEWQRAHERNREKRLLRMRTYHAQHREEHRAYMKEHRKAHGEEERARDRARWKGKRKRRANELRKEHAQTTRLTLPWKPLLKAARDRATRKGVPFTLTAAWARKNWTGRCAITKIPFALGQRGSGPKALSPSIDRIVPDLGYTPDNCRFVLWAVNLLKYDQTDDSLHALAKSIIQSYEASNSTIGS